MHPPPPSPQPDIQASGGVPRRRRVNLRPLCPELAAHLLHPRLRRRLQVRVRVGVDSVLPGVLSQLLLEKKRGGGRVVGMRMSVDVVGGWEQGSSSRPPTSTQNPSPAPSPTFNTMHTITHGPTCVICMEQNLGPHMLQKWAVCRRGEGGRGSKGEGRG